MMGTRPITMKFGTQLYFTKTYTKNKQLQVCKQQQTASGNNTCKL